MLKYILLLCLILPTQRLVSQFVDAYIPDFKVNDDNLNSYQTNSSIGVDSSGNFVIVWNDVRDNPGNQLPPQIYCQRYNEEGIPLANNFRIGHDTASGGQINVLNDGRFIVTWGRSFNNYSMLELYFQRFSKNGVPLNQPTRVIDTSYSINNSGFIGSSIASDTMNNFVICWSKYAIEDTTRMYFQRYDSSGNRIGVPQRVNEAKSIVENPQIAINNDGSFVIAWHDNRNNIFANKYDVYLQRYNVNGIKLGNNVKVNDDVDTMVNQYIGGISTDKEGYTVIVWSDERLDPIYGIFYQLYDLSGNAIGSNRRADISTVWYSTGQPKVSMREDGKFIIGWLDLSYASKEQYYGRRFEMNGNPIGNPYMFPSSSPSPTEQRPDAVYLLNDRVYATWTNFIQGNNNTDIYCNVRGFQNPDTVIGITNISNTAKEYKLYTPYPNPFNPSTKIKFQTAKTGFVKISIYDITGREVIVLVSELKQPGFYETVFDGKNLASGLYIYRIEAGQFVDVKKMVLVK